MDERKKTIAEQLEEIRLEKEVYELEKLQEESELRAEKRASDDARRKQVIADERMSREKRKAEQSVCKHRKGGKDRQGFMNGNSADYAVIHHRYDIGVEMVRCQRCGKEAWPGDKHYAEWMQFPTDNEASGGVSFGNLDPKAVQKFIDEHRAMNA